MKRKHICVSICASHIYIHIYIRTYKIIFLYFYVRSCPSSQFFKLSIYIYIFIFICHGGGNSIILSLLWHKWISQVLQELRCFKFSHWVIQWDGTWWLPLTSLSWLPSALGLWLQLAFRHHSLSLLLWMSLIIIIIIIFININITISWDS